MGGAGADFDEGVERGWWLERRGKRNPEEMETAVFPAEYEDGDALADEDGPDKPLAVLGGAPTSSPPEVGGTNDDNELLAPLPSDGDDDDDDEDGDPPPPPPRVSARGNQGVPSKKSKKIRFCFFGTGKL